MRAIRLLLCLTVMLGLQLQTTSAAAQITCAETASSSTSPAATPAPTVEPVEFLDGEFTLTVFAAASLVDAFGEINAALESAHPGLTINLETAGSQTLVTQLQEGASADVLATANTSTMTTAVDAGLIDGDTVVFTGNRLVLVTPADNPAGIDSLDDLAGDVDIILAQAEVPAGNYARQTLCAYDASDAAPDGFLDAVSDNIVSDEPDVRHVLTKIQLGEADAGFVYASDAAASEMAGNPLNVIALPDDLPVAAAYPIAPVAGGQTDLARAYISYVMSPEGQATLQKYGFQ